MCEASGFKPVMIDDRLPLHVQDKYLPLSNEILAHAHIFYRLLEIICCEIYTHGMVRRERMKMREKREMQWLALFDSSQACIHVWCERERGRGRGREKRKEKMDISPHTHAHTHSHTHASRSLLSLARSLSHTPHAHYLSLTHTHAHTHQRRMLGFAV